MSDLKNLYAKLESNFNIIVDEKVEGKEWEDAIDNYVNAVEGIIEKDCIASLPVLLRYFDDNNHTDFVLECLKNRIRDYGYHNNRDDAYVKALLQHIHIMLPHAIDYATQFAHYMLCDEESYEMLKNNLLLADRESLISILEHIRKESAIDDQYPYDAIAEEVLNLLGK